jgi:hypothetical protein
MLTRFERISALAAAVLAVALWIVGLVVTQALTTGLSDKATDAQVLAWVHGNKNPILTGSWLFMIGCLAFVWFAGVLRSRLAAAEAGDRTLSTIAFAGAVMAAAFGIAGQSDIASAINADSVSAATAGTLHRGGDVMFVGSELSIVLLLGAVAVLAFRTAVVPRWWGVAGALVAVVALIGPIGWAALIFGLPVWTLVTAGMLARAPRGRLARTAATAATA